MIEYKAAEKLAVGDSVVERDGYVLTVDAVEHKNGRIRAICHSMMRSGITTPWMRRSAQVRVMEVGQ